MVKRRQLMTQTWAWLKAATRQTCGLPEREEKKGLR